MFRLSLNTVYYTKSKGFKYRGSDLSGQSVDRIASGSCKEMGNNYCQLLPGTQFINHKVVIDTDINESILTVFMSLKNFINTNYRAITKKADYLSVKLLIRKMRLRKE